MAHCPDYEEFCAVVARLERAEREIHFLKSQLMAQQWLSRAQARRALGISESTLFRLTQRGALTFRYEGSKLLYCVQGIRAYLNRQKIEPSVVDGRVLSALTDAHTA
ncbi:MAG: hypothetical protein JWP57_1536 [Spirosoma sp.]|nr:hypothetical protein [Spirosoma sp.]